MDVPVAPQPPPAHRLQFIRDRLPREGLFAGHDWRIAVRPFRIDAKLMKELEALGRVLLQFQRASNTLYHQSLRGKQPAWIAELLDRGKPEELLRWQRHAAFKNDLPRVIRPDVLPTDDGFAISELDSVPGGIGLTAWLNQTYAAAGENVVGGERGMLDGFAGIFADRSPVHLMVSEEAATYRPEMAWLAEQLGADRFCVKDQTFAEPADGAAVYRFFELFDLANIPAATTLFDKAANGAIQFTPPPKAVPEEKLWLALLWNRNLHDFWRQQLGDAFLRRLQQHVPRSWVVDPEPLPPHAAYPGLELTDWNQLKTLSQKERELILKVSGFSPEAWGARGVHLGSDLSSGDWSEAVDTAIRQAPIGPSILQRYHKPRLVEIEYFDPDTDEVKVMNGRARLCPYYFVHGEGDNARAHLGGVLATVCPADKKIIHGMRDAVLAPCAAE